LPAQATSIQWTAPVGGSIISGQGTLSIEVSYVNTAVNGYVTAQAVNNCTVSSIRNSLVKLTPCTGFTTGKNNPTKTIGTKVSPMEVKIFPNPTTSDFKLQVITADDEAIKVMISDASGRIVKTIKVNPFESVNLGAELKAGIYLVTVSKGNEVKTTRVVKY